MSYPTFKMTWRGQWMPADEIANLERAGAMMLTEERINKMLDHASKAGHERGKQTGRYEMRQDIEHGRVDPITVLPECDQDHTQTHDEGIR